MRIIDTTWAQLPVNALVLDPTGRIWQVAGFERFADGVPYVALIDPESHEAVQLKVGPADPVQTLTTLEQHALMVLSRYFPNLERI